MIAPEKEDFMKLVKGIVAIIIAATIAVASACIASNATRENLAPEQMKVWVEGNVIYIETQDGNVWVHEVE